MADEYADFVFHPRYGRGPRYTAVRLREASIGYYRVYPTVYESEIIRGTAVEADIDRQSWSPLPVLYYFDRKRTCVDCRRPFIFFADEQKHWYEDLGFNMVADCIRCVPCRKERQGMERLRRRYTELLHAESRSDEQKLEMADCSLTLMENKVFHPRQTERVRMLLHSLPEEAASRYRRRVDELIARLRSVEGRPGGGVA